MLASEKEGYVKPDPFLFRKALQLSGISAGEAIHVGDNYMEDIEAARGLGIAAVLVEREGSSGVHSPSICSLEQLIPLVESDAWIQGIVVNGSGEASGFTQLQWVQDEMKKRLGFVPYPGTFNLRPGSTADQIAFMRLKACPGIHLEAKSGFCAARCYPVVVEGRAPGAVVVPEVSDYPEDKLEVVAPVSLRDLLKVREGSRVTLTVAVRPVADRWRENDII